MGSSSHYAFKKKGEENYIAFDGLMNQPYYVDFTDQRLLLFKALIDAVNWLKKNQAFFGDELLDTPPISELDLVGINIAVLTTDLSMFVRDSK